jgi:hypothetical protein
MDNKDISNRAMDNRDTNNSKDMAALDSNRDSSKWADRKDMAALDSNRDTNNPADSSSTDTNNKALSSNLSKDMDNNRAMAKDISNKCKCPKDPG